MLTINNSVFGWTPMDDDEEVVLSPDTCFMTIKPFSMPTNASFNPAFTSVHTTPETCPPHSRRASIASSSDRRAQRNRNRDPSWIPRPRNAFIIFRCEYSREHSQGAQECQSDDDANLTVKTLSKRAAEAWRQLSTPEKERYKVLADKEREEHARLYPNYRFRPMKRQMSGPRKPSRERSEGPRAPSAERPPAPSTQLPSVLARAPDKPGSSRSCERAELSDIVSRPLPVRPVDATSEVPLSVDYDSLLSYTFPEVTLPSDTSSPSEPVELYPPSVFPDTFHFDDSTSGVDVTQEEIERAQALEAYAIGLNSYDPFSPFTLPGYY